MFQCFSPQYLLKNIFQNLSKVSFSPYGRFVTKLLEDLIFFVADVLNNGQEVLDVVIIKPNRERQKLMREQNILAQVNVFMY